MKNADRHKPCNFYVKDPNHRKTGVAFFVHLAPGGTVTSPTFPPGDPHVDKLSSKVMDLLQKMSGIQELHILQHISSFLPASTVVKMQPSLTWVLFPGRIWSPELLHFLFRWMALPPSCTDVYNMCM